MAFNSAFKGLMYTCSPSNIYLCIVEIYELKTTGLNPIKIAFIKKVNVDCSKSGDACYRSGQNVVPCFLLSNNIKIKIHITIILSVVLYGCETWSLTLREEH